MSSSLSDDTGIKAEDPAGRGPWGGGRGRREKGEEFPLERRRVPINWPALTTSGRSEVLEGRRGGGRRGRRKKEGGGRRREEGKGGGRKRWVAPERDFCFCFPGTLSIPKLFADGFIWFLFEEKREWDDP